MIHGIFNSVSTFGENPRIKTPETLVNFYAKNTEGNQVVAKEKRVGRGLHSRHGQLWKVEPIVTIGPIPFWNLSAKTSPPKVSMVGSQPSLWRIQDDIDIPE